MRKITAGLFMTLDGVVEAPERWNMPYFNDEMGAIVGASFAGADTLLLGRRTYEVFAASWPQRQGDPMADMINAMPKLVASTTLERADWQNSTIIRGDVPAELARLKAGPGKNLAISGSPTLVGSLLRAGVLDELTLLVHPLVLGQGQRLFAAIGGEVPLALSDSRALATGVVALTYGPVGAQG